MLYLNQIIKGPNHLLSRANGPYIVETDRLIVGEHDAMVHAEAPGTGRVTGEATGRPIVIGLDVNKTMSVATPTTF